MKHIYFKNVHKKHFVLETMPKERSAGKSFYHFITKVTSVKLIKG